MAQYTTVNVEGGLFPTDILDAVAAGTADGQRPADFQLEAPRLLDELQAAFADVRSFWDAFRRRSARGRPDTSLTRQAWVIPLLERLGYDLEYQQAALTAGNATFTISHLHGRGPHTPVHIVAFEQELDRKDGAGRRSPHALVQEYLNRTDALWGLVSNGRKLRLLRNTERMAKPSYVEFDLEGMIESDKYSEFALLYRLLHATRFPPPGSDPARCWLETYYQQGNDLGGRVRDGMRDGVSSALETLGNAFLRHEANEDLRRAIENGRLTSESYYRQLLRLVYRFLFLMVAEERGLISPPDQAGHEGHVVYDRYYAISRLRDRSERYYAENRHHDLWEGVKSTFALFREDDLARKLGLRALDGELFGQGACPDLEACTCLNVDLLRAVRELSTYREKPDSPRRRVNFRDIDTEEFGSVYESLLDFHPVADAHERRFSFLAGSERKSTGSYYTPSPLVHELVESALVPVMQERLAAASSREGKEAAILDMRVIDPAAGSGHFLLAAGRRMARELARVRTDEAEPPVEDYRRALRDVIRNSIYAVDKNPLAVDLCKVALWIEGHNAGLPLGFLDNHIKLGDSLVGVFDLGVLKAGIPDEAYKPVTGDDKAAARGFRDRNKRERQGQVRLAAFDPEALERSLAPDFVALGELEDDSPTDVKAKEELYAKLRSAGSQWWRLKVACDLWTYAFFAPLEPQTELAQQTVPTTVLVWEALGGGATHAFAQARAMAASAEQPYFHWPLEFPDIFAGGGFDIVLGNPPWERVEMQEQEFFAVRSPAIANARNASHRKEMIEALGSDNPQLAQEFLRARRLPQVEVLFFKESGRFPYGSEGKVNTYALFADLFRQAIDGLGACALLLPNGLVTGYTYRAFLRYLLQTHTLTSFYGFENEDKIFPDVHNETKFGILTLTGRSRPAAESTFTAHVRKPEQIYDPVRRYSLTPEQIEAINPNTLNIPAFRFARDAEITTKIHSSGPALVKITGDGSIENSWRVRFKQLFNMATDSGHFLEHQHVQSRIRDYLGAAAVLTNGEVVYPLYEGKMLWHFDHRYGTYEGQTEKQANKGVLPHVSDAKHADPYYRIQPRYWITEALTREALGTDAEREWFFAWRDVGPTERTLVGTIVPRTAAGHKAPFLVSTLPAREVAGLTALLSSLVVDYDARQKSAGMSFFVMEQLAVLNPARLQEKCAWLPDRAGNWLSDRVLELSYTNVELAPFARDIGFDGPPFQWIPVRRFLLQAEIDAVVMHLYDLSRTQAEWLIDSFTVLRKYEERDYGEYRTKRVILEMYDEMAEAMKTGRPYQTWLDPPPADTRVAHSTEIPA